MNWFAPYFQKLYTLHLWTDTSFIPSPLFLVEFIWATLFPSFILFFFVHENKLKVNLVLMMSWCLLSPGFCGIGPSCCLYSVPAVCLHMCKEGIRWEDTGHPGPAEKTVSVCLLKICLHLCFINSSHDRRDVHSVRFIRLSLRVLARSWPVCDRHADLWMLLGNVTRSVCGLTICQSLCDFLI